MYEGGPSKRLRTVSTSDHSPTTPREDTEDNTPFHLPDIPEESADLVHHNDNDTENDEKAPAKISSQISDDGISPISVEEKCKLWLQESATFFVDFR